MTTPPITLPPTADECEREIEMLSDDLDPISALDVLIQIADHLDVDLTEIMMEIKLGRDQACSPDSPLALIADIIDASQSNRARSVDRIYRASALFAHKIEIENA